MFKRTKGKKPYNMRYQFTRSWFRPDITKLKGFVPVDFSKTREQFVAEQRAKLDIDNILALSNRRMITPIGELFKKEPELVFSHADYQEVVLPHPYREIGG
jgi:hypothetical protein